MIKEGWKEQLEEQRHHNGFDETAAWEFPESIIETMARSLLKSILDKSENGDKEPGKEESE